MGNQALAVGFWFQLGGVWGWLGGLVEGWGLVFSVRIGRVGGGQAMPEIAPGNLGGDRATPKNDRPSPSRALGKQGGDPKSPKSPEKVSRAENPKDPAILKILRRSDLLSP